MADADLNLYDEIEIEDCFYDSTLQIYHHPCPCGDRFEISIYDMRDGEDIARCPSCSLMIRIIFDQVSGQEGMEKEDVEGCGLMWYSLICPRRRMVRRESRLLLLREWLGCIWGLIGVAWGCIRLAFWNTTGKRLHA